MTGPEASEVPSMVRHPETEPIGVLGLGLMGTALAERLLEHGRRVVVWNRTREKAAPLLARGASWSDNPLADCERVLVSLYSSPIVAEVLRPLLAAAKAGAVVIDTTTGEPDAVLAIGRELADRGLVYLDAPISGSSVQARRGEAAVIVGGEAAAFAAGADLWPLLGNRVFHVGPLGAGTKMKLVSNLVLGLNRAALAEGLAYADAVGVDGGAALEVLLGTMAYSRIMDTKGRKMVERDFAVQARLSQHLKDVRLMLESAARAGVALPLTETHRELLERAEALGWGEADNSALVEVLRRARPPASS